MVILLKLTSSFRWSYTNVHAWQSGSSRYH